MNEQSTQSGSISLEALKAGDRRAFADLVNQYSNQIYRLALKILGDPLDAEDVLQDTFIKAMRAIQDFEGRSSLSTWLYRIAVNEALMMVRKKKPEFVSVESEPVGDEEDTEGMQIVDWCCLPEQELLSSESRKFLDKAISEMPENLKVVFLLRDMEGFSIRETAEMLSLTETNVKTRLLRARFHLRQVLSAYFGEHVAERPEK